MNAKRLLSLLALIILPLVVAAAPVDDRIAEGRAALAAHDLATARAKFQQARAADSTNQTAAALLGITRWFAMIGDGPANTVLNGLGVSASGRDLYNWNASLSQDAKGEGTLPAGYNWESTRAFWRDTVTPTAAAVRADFAAVTDDSFVLTLTPAETGGAHTLTVDRADLLVLQAGLRAFEMFIHAGLGQNFNADYEKLLNLAKGDVLSFRQAMEDNPDLFKAGPLESRQSAKAALLDFVTLYRRASAAVRARPAGLDRMFMLETEDDLSGEAEFRRQLASLEKAATDYVELDDGKKHVSLAPMFTAGWSLRGSLPTMTNGRFDPATVADATLGGVLLGTSREFFAHVLESAGYTPDIGWTRLNPNPVSAALYRYAYSGAYHIVTCQNGLIGRSADGVNWTYQTLPNCQDLFSVASNGAGLLVAEGNTQLWRSTDHGATWKLAKTTWRHSAPDNEGGMFGLVWDGAKFTTLTSNGYVYTSSADGSTWTRGDRIAPGSVSLSILGLEYLNGLYIASGYSVINGNARGTIFTSTNGTNWNIAFTGSTTNFMRSAGYGAGKWIVAGNGGRVAVSTDGVTWAESLVGTTSDNFYGAAYVGGTWIISGTRTGTSTDGVTWNFTANPEGLLFQRPGAGPDGYVYLLSNQGALYRYASGNFTKLDTNTSFMARSATLSDAVIFNGKLYLCGSGGTVYESADGVNFVTRQTSTTNYLYSLAVHNGQLFAAGSAGTIVSTADGANWTTRISNDASLYTGQLLRLVSVNGQLLAVSTGNVILVSPTGLAGSWARRTLPSGSNTLNSAIAYGGGYYVVGLGGVYNTATLATETSVAVSTDTVTWTRNVISMQPGNTASAANVRSIFFEDGHFYYFINNGEVLRTYSVSPNSGWEYAANKLGQPVASAKLGAALVATTGRTNDEARSSLAYSFNPDSEDEWVKTETPTSEFLGATPTLFANRTYIVGGNGGVYRSANTFARPAPVAAAPSTLVGTIGHDVTLAGIFTASEELTYQWSYNGTPIFGATSRGLTLNNLTNVQAGTYTVTATGVTTGTTVANTVTLLVVNGPPQITQQPSGGTAQSGAAFTFTVAASGSGTLTYQWFRNNLALAGATSATLTLNSASVNDAGTYRVEVSNASGTTVSSDATLGISSTGAAAAFWDDTETVFSPNRLVHDGNGKMYASWNVSVRNQDVVNGIHAGSFYRLDENTGAVDPTFVWDERLGSPLFPAIQTDGKIIVSVNHGPGEGSTVVRVSATGARDASFVAPHFDRRIRFLSLQADGKVVLAATDGVAAGGLPVDAIVTSNPKIYRLNANGSLDSSFTPVELSSGAVLYAPPAIDAAGNIYVAGSFTTVNGTARRGLARVNASGTLDSVFAATTNLPAGWTNAIGRAVAFQSSGKIIVAGRFGYTARGNYNSDPVIAVRFNADGTFDNTFVPPLRSQTPTNTSVSSYARYLLVDPSDKLLITTDRLLRFNADGTLDANWPAASVAFGKEGFWISRSPVSGNLYVPDMQNIDGQIAAFTAAGQPLEGFDTGGFGTTNTPSSAIVLKDGRLLAAGYFDHYGPNRMPGTALFGANGVLAGDATAFHDAGVLLNNPSANVFQWVDGSFGLFRWQIGDPLTGAGGTSAEVRRFNPDGTSRAGWNFEYVNGTPSNFSPLPDGGLITWTNSVSALSVINSGSGTWLQRFNADGSLDGSFKPDFAFLTSLARDNDGYWIFSQGTITDLQIAGDGSLFFLTADRDGSVRMRKLLPNGQPDPAYTAVALGTATVSTGYTSSVIYDPVKGTSYQIPVTSYSSSNISCRVLPDGSAYVVGALTYNGTPRKLVRLTPAGAVDTTVADLTVSLTHPLGYYPLVTGTALDGVGRFYVAGRFDNINGTAVPGLARLTPQGAFDSTWSPGVEIRDELGLGVTMVAGPDYLNILGPVAAPSDVRPVGFKRVALTSAQPTIVGQSTSGTVYAGQSTFLYAGVFGGGNMTYVWTRNGTTIAGATTPVLNLGTVDATAAGTYQLTATNANGSVQTTAIVLTVSNQPVITTQPVAVTVTEGASATFSVTAVSGSTLSYQWKKGATALTGATSATYTIPATVLGDAGNYSVVVTNAAGSVESTAVALTVNAKPAAATFTQQPQSQTVYNGYNIALTATITPPSGATVTNYQWYRDGSLYVTQTSSLTTASLTVSAPAAGASNSYYVVANTSNGGAATSSTATLTSASSGYGFSTVAGVNTRGSADGTGATARFSYPNGAAVDAAGNIYVADTNNQTIRLITPAGVVSTYAGAAGVNSTVDGALSVARFSSPNSVVIAPNGDLYVLQPWAIRKISGGTVTTFAGSGSTSGAVDGTGTAARFNSLSRGVFDSAGNLYVTETGGQTVRKITPAGVVTTYAGTSSTTGYADGAPGVGRFSQPSGIALLADGSLLVLDTNNSALRKVDTAGNITTIVGAPPPTATGQNTDGVGTAARLVYPRDLVQLPNGELFIADGSSVLRRVETSLNVTTPVGTAYQPGFTDGTGSAARFNNPRSIAWDNANSRLIVVDGYNTVRTVTTAGVVATLAGLPPGSADGTAAAARFFGPDSLVLDTNGDLIVADNLNRTLRKMTTAGVVTTFSGVASSSGSIVNGSATTARFNGPRGLARHPLTGEIYVFDSYNIRKVAADGSVSPVAGPGNYTNGNSDGVGTAARFGYDGYLAFAPNGDLYATDSNNATIRKITADGTVTTIAGVAGSLGAVDGSVAGGAASSAVRFSYPRAIAVDSAGVIYVVQGSCIRKIDTAGNVTTLAGLPNTGSQVDGAPPTARLGYPTSMTIGPDGHLYVGTSSAIQRINTANGTVTTLVGNVFASGYVDASGTSARADSINGLVFAADGSLYFSDYNNSVIRRANTASVISFTTQPVSWAVPVGANVTFTAAATGVSGINYQWMKSGVDIPNATSASYTLSNVQLVDAGAYSVRAFAGNAVAYSSIATLTVQTAVANDHFANATVLTGLSGTAPTVNNAVATGEAGEPVHFNNNTTSSSIWYAYRPIASGLATFDTAGSAIDTAMAVYTGTALSNLAFLAQNNDAPGTTTSRLTLPVTVGTTYYIAVGSNFSTRGNIVLNHSLAVTPQPGVAVVTAGASGSLTVAPDTASGVTVQWQKDGADLAGATSATLAQTGSGVFLPGFAGASGTASYASSLPVAQLSVPVNSVIATDSFNPTALASAWSQTDIVDPYASSPESRFLVNGRLVFDVTSSNVTRYTREVRRATSLPLDRPWTAVLRVGVDRALITGADGAGSLRSAGIYLTLTHNNNPTYYALKTGLQLINDTGATTARLERIAAGMSFTTTTSTLTTGSSALVRLDYNGTGTLTTAVSTGGAFTSTGTLAMFGGWGTNASGFVTLGVLGDVISLNPATGALWADDLAVVVQPPAAPAITTQPLGATNAPEGGTSYLDLVFTLQSLNPWSVQWFKDGVAIPDAVFSGSYQTSVNTAGYGATAPGSYYAVITQNGVSTTTNTVTITQVPSAPVFATAGNITSSFAAAGGVVPAGSSVALTVTPLAGSAPMDYQWQFNGVDIPGATAASYFVGNWQLVHQGTYSVRAHNSLGTVTTAAEKFFVTPEGGWRWRNPTPTGNGATRVAFINGQFILGGLRGTLLVSADGLTWTTRQVPAQNNIFKFVTLGDRLLAMASLNGMFTTKDTITWETRPTGINGANTSLQDVVAGAGRAVAFGTGGVTAVTTDGLTWTPGSLGNGRTDTLFGATFVLNRYFGVSGTDGSVFSSADGLNWTSVATGATAGLRGMAFGAGRLVAVGADGVIVVSTNGTTWAPVASGTTNPLYGVNFVNNRFVAVGALGTILTSPDGLVWTPRSAQGNQSNLQNTAYGNGRYVIAGQAGRVILTSTDAENWTILTGGPLQGTHLNGVATSGSLVTAIGDSNAIVTSTDAATWTQRTASPNNGTQLNDITYAQGKFIAVGALGTVIASSDGATWTTQATSSAISSTALNGVRYFAGPGLWVTVGNSGGIYTAPDGALPFTWTKRTSGTTAQLRKVAAGGGMFVAVGSAGVITSSSDATATWTIRTTGTTATFNDVVYGNGAFVAVGNSGTVSRSTDGATWTTTALGVNQLISATFINGQFIVTASSNNYYTSTDGINWVGRTTGAADALKDTVLFGNQVVGVGNYGTILTAGAPVVEGGGTLNADPGTPVALKFAVSQSPEPVTYTWFKDGNALSGAPSSPVLNLASVSVNDAGAYTLQAQNSYGTVTSENAVNVVLNVSLAITQQPQPQTVLVGGTASFSVTATGTPAPNYQWKLNGVNVGTDSPELTLTGLRLVDTGKVTVTLTNAAGTVTSTPATLTVNPLAPTITSPSTAFAVAGAPFRFPVVASTVATFGATGLPSGLAINATTGVIEGSTTQTGIFNVGLTAHNVTGDASQTLQLTVQPPAPVITGALSVSGRVGVAFTYTITATNSPTDYAAFALPAGITRSGAVLSGTPTAAGFYSAQILASNATGFASAPLSIQIAPPLNAPTFTGSGNVPGTAGTVFSFAPAFGGSPTSFTLVNLPDGSPSVLPTGLSLNATTGAITGTTTQTGTFKVAIRAANADGSLTQVFTLTINPAPTAPAIKSATSAIATVGTAFTFNITTDPAATSFSSTALPDGLTLNATTGVITGVPTAPGITNVTLTATNAAGSSSSSLQITVNSSASAPVVTSAAVAPGRVGTEFFYTITASNSPTSFVVTQGTLPAGLSLNAETGLISGLPSVAGQTKVWVAASNVAGGRGPAVEILIDLARALTVPVITSNGTASGQVGATFQYQIVATNSPTAYTATTLPDGLTFNTGTGVISGIPTTETAAPFEVTLTAVNADGASAPKTLAISIVPAPATPKITSALSAGGRVGAAFNYQISATETPTSFTTDQLPAGLVLNSSTGAISGTPTASGTTSVQVRAANAVGLGQASTLVIEIAAPLTAPAITSDPTANAKVGAFFSYQIVATNTPTGYAVTGSLPGGLALNSSTGVISGNPADSPGLFAVYLTASNSAGASQPQQLLINVAPADNTPVITSASTASGMVGVAFSYQISATNVPATTPFPPSVSLDALGLPSGLAVNASTGLIEGTPANVGTYTVALYGVNSNGTGPSRLLTIVVSPAPNAPSITSGTSANAQAGTAFSYQITATNNPTSFEALDAPAWLSVNTTSGLLSGTPTGPGTATVRLGARNAGGASNYVTLTLTIAAAPNTPVITSEQQPPAGRLGQAFSYDLTATLSPTSFEVSGLPPGLTVNTAGQIRGTPTASGTYSVTVSGRNANGQGQPVVVTIVIQASLTLSGGSSG